MPAALFFASTFHQCMYDDDNDNIAGKAHNTYNWRSKCDLIVINYIVHNYISSEREIGSHIVIVVVVVGVALFLWLAIAVVVWPASN